MRQAKSEASKTQAAKKARNARRICIGKNLKECRERSDPKLTQESVAQLFNPPLSREAIAQWEVGVTLPDVDRLAILSKAFGVTIDALIFGDDAPATTSISPEATRVARSWQQLTKRNRDLVLSLMQSMKS